MFDTYGPFVMSSHDDSGLDGLFEQIKGKNPDLEHGVGVYIVAAGADTNSLKPWYVGRTRKEFGTRLIQHYKRERFAPLFRNPGVVGFFLLPRATSRGKIITTDRSSLNTGAIDKLEFMLIGTCLRLNPQLLNKQKTGFPSSLHVAGYIDAGPSDRTFEAAIALSKLLRT